MKIVHDFIRDFTSHYLSSRERRNKVYFASDIRISMRLKQCKCRLRYNNAKTYNRERIIKTKNLLTLLHAGQASF